MNDSSKIILNTVVSYVSLIIKMIIGILSVRLVLNALGEIDYGVYIIVGGVVAMLDVLNTNMSNTSMRYLAYSLGKKDENEIYITFNSTIIIHYLIGFLTILILEIGGLVMFEYIINIPTSKIPDAKIIYQFMVFSTFISVITVPYDAMINAYEKIWVLSIFDILTSTFVLTVAIILLSFYGNRLLFYGFCLLMIQVSICFLKMFFAKRYFIECRRFNKKKVEKKRIIEILSFTGWNLFGSLSSIGITQFRSLILNFFFGVRLNAAEGVSGQVTSPLNMVVVSMTRAINPQIMKSEGGDNHERMKYIVEMGAKYSSFLFALFGIPVLIELPIILDWWLEKVPEYTSVFCQLTIIMMLMEKLTFQIVHAINAVGNIKSFQVSNAICSMLYLPFAWILFYQGYPPVTIYLLSLLSYFLVGGIRLYFGKKVAGISPVHFIKTAINPVLTPLVISSLMALGSSILINNEIVNVITVFIVFFISFTVSFWILSVSTDERQRWKSIYSQVVERWRFVAR